ELEDVVNALGEPGAGHRRLLRGGHRHLATAGHGEEGERRRATDRRDPTTNDDADHTLAPRAQRMSSMKHPAPGRRFAGRTTDEERSGARRRERRKWCRRRCRGVLEDPQGSDGVRLTDAWTDD